MPLGQGWLNAWVKVNSKHVIFPPSNKAERDSHKEDAANIGHNNRGAKAQLQKAAANSVSTALTAVSDDTGNQAIHRYTARKKNRRLQRTVSATDLMIEKAYREDLGMKYGSEIPIQERIVREPAKKPADNEATAQTSHTENLESTISSTAQLGDDEKSCLSVVTDDSLKFVSGFFGADIESYSSGHGDAASARGSIQDQHARRSVGSWTDSSSLKEAERKMSRLHASSVVPVGGHSTPAPRYGLSGVSKSAALSKSDSHESQHSSRSQGGSIGIRFPQNLFAGDHAKSNCRNCRQMHNELLSSQEDLEYLRSMALRSEYICSSCQTHPSNQDRVLKESQEKSIQEGAQMMNELIARHKNEIEQLTKERARWQHDTNVKLQKFASLCKDLDEEAALRNDEAISLYHELDVVRAERDEMATELEKLRAKVAQSEKVEAESRKSELLLQQIQTKGLDGADEAIQQRDAMIVNLTDRLQRALDVLELEREQQRQRRQIIFPVARSSFDGRKGEDLEAELRSTKDALRDSQAAMATLQLNAEKNEIQWKIRLEELERQLDAARSS